jgi:hypothetical protein
MFLKTKTKLWFKSAVSKQNNTFDNGKKQNRNFFVLSWIYTTENKDKKHNVLLSQKNSETKQTTAFKPTSLRTE